MKFDYQNNLTKDDFLSALKNGVLNENELSLLKHHYLMPNHTASATELAISMNLKNYRAVNNHHTSIAKKVSRYSGKVPFKNKEGITYWWSFLFIAERKGNFDFFTLRPQVTEAIQVFFENSKTSSSRDLNGEYDWRLVVTSWANKSKSTKDFTEHLIQFFTKAFQNTILPNESFFGYTRQSISLIIGRIYLAACNRGNEDGIWLLLDKELKLNEGIKISLVRSTSKAPERLFWLHFSDLGLLNAVLQNQEIWDSYRRSSYLVAELSTHGKNPLENKINSKRTLASFFLSLGELNADLLALENTIQELENQDVNSIEGILKLETKMKDLMPSVKERISTYIERGQIAKRIKRVTGFKCLICEELGLNPLSFKKKDEEYYVETHHVEPVSKAKQGSLGLSNLITVCANHHRQLHYGDVEVSQNNESFIFKIDGKEVIVKKIAL